MRKLLGICWSWTAVARCGPLSDASHWTQKQISAIRTNKQVEKRHTTVKLSQYNAVRCGEQLSGELVSVQWRKFVFSTFVSALRLVRGQVPISIYKCMYVCVLILSFCYPDAYCQHRDGFKSDYVLTTLRGRLAG